jgi:hypothetical protein
MMQLMLPLLRMCASLPLTAELSASKHGIFPQQLELTCFLIAAAAASAVYICIPAVTAQSGASKHGISPPHWSSSALLHDATAAVAAVYV